jgi:hypothetical protein
MITENVESEYGGGLGMDLRGMDSYIYWNESSGEDFIESWRANPDAKWRMESGL